MGYYMERGLEFKEEGTFNVRADATIPFNYALGWDITTDPVLIEEEIVGAGRDAISRVKAHKEVAGRIEAQMLSAKFFKYVLGSLSPDSITAPFTIDPSKELPSFTIKRGLTDPTNVAWYTGCKVDSAVIHLEVEEDVTYEINLVGADGTVETATPYTAPTIAYTVSPYIFCDGYVKYGGSVVTDLQSCDIEINNNLVVRYSADSTRTRPKSAYRIQEQRLGVTGRFVCGETVETYIADILSGNTFSLEFKLTKLDQATVIVTMPNVMLREYSDTGRGREIYEVEFPFLCSPTTGGTLDIIRIVQKGATWNQSYA